MFLNTAIILAVLLTAFALWSPKIRRLVTWRAMTTPLASIIGSGFLVLGPILDAAYGMYAPLVMAILCVVAYAYGTAIRYNMAVIATTGNHPSKSSDILEKTASWSLGFAYIISVTYYLNLFGAFGVSLTAVNDPFHAKLLTSAIFVVIIFIGWTGGFKSLEGMEYVSVTTKLAIIAGLLVGLLVYFNDKTIHGGLFLNKPDLTGWPAITLAFGLIVTVQGFETSRYLGAEYNNKTRVRSMWWSQLISGAIYMAYILLLTYVFERGQLKLTETAIVDMMSLVAPILPVLLVAAALAAQFSAAVADTAGSGGLISEQTAGRINPRVTYALLVIIGLFLTWTADVFQIISYASRAFAIYYSLQASIAAVLSWRAKSRLYSACFMGLAVLGILITLFGQPFEG